MKSEKFFGYAPEINKLAEAHTGAILALYLEAFKNGMQVGYRNALIGASVVGFMGAYIAITTYLEYKRKL